MTAWPDPKEKWGFPFWRRTRRAIVRAFKRQLDLERKYTERLLDDLLHAMRTELEFSEQRMLDRLEEIDTSLNLIARDLARRTDDRSSGAVNYEIAYHDIFLGTKNCRR